MASEQLEGAQLSPEEEEISEAKQLKKIQKKYDEHRKNIKIYSFQEQFPRASLLSGSIERVKEFSLLSGRTVKQINPSHSRE